jgi:hypothetical protein
MGISLVNKRIVHIQIRVLRHFGQRTLATSTTSSGTSLSDVIKKGHIFNVRKELERDARNQITKSEFFGICLKSHINKSDAAELLQKFQDIGLVFIFNEDIIQIKPEVVLQSLHKVIDVTYDPHQTDRTELARLRSLQQPLQQRKDFVDSTIQRSVNRFFAGSGAMLAIQMAVLGRFTFIDFDWDIMEPVTYFLTTGTATLMFAYYTFNKKEYSYPGLEQQLINRRQLRFYQKFKFDWVTYSHLQNQIAEIERKLASTDLSRQQQ